MKDAQITGLTTDPIAKTVLENGVRIVSEYMPHIRSVSVGIWILVGSRDEDAGNNGVSHLIEHMVFKGTQKRSAIQIAECLEAVGGHLDAFTGKEVTCYNAHVLDEHLELAVDVLSDIVLNPIFPEDEFEKEKAVILREINHTLETPDDLVFEYFYENIFPEHPLGLQISGTLDSVSQISLNQMREFMKKHYIPGRIVIAAAGNVRHDELVPLIQKYFKIESDGSRRVLLPPAWKNRGNHVYHSTGNQAHLCMGFPGLAYGDMRKYGMLVLNSFLGNGMSSRLFQVVREKYGLAYSIFSFLDFFEDTGVLGVYSAVLPDAVERTVELIQQELFELTKNHLKTTDFERAKSQLKGNIMLGLENSVSRMGRLANIEIYLREYIGLDQVLKSIEKTTLQDVHAVASELIHQDFQILTILTTQNDTD